MMKQAVREKLPNSNESEPLWARRRFLLSLLAAAMPACDRPAAGAQLADHEAGFKPPRPGSLPEAYAPFLSEVFRTEQSDAFLKTHAAPADGRFVLPYDYQWELEVFIEEKAAVGTDAASVPDALFSQMDQAVLGMAMMRHFEHWVHPDLPEDHYTAFRGRYARQTYEHYRLLRFMEVLPARPDRRPWKDKDYETLIQTWSGRELEVWKKLQASPFFGPHHDPVMDGPLEKAFSAEIESRLTRIVASIPTRETEDFKRYKLGRIRLALLDLHLPAMYRQVIHEKLQAAGLAPERAGLEAIKKITRKGASYRAKLFLHNIRQYDLFGTDKRIFRALAGQAELLSGDAE